MLRSKPVNRRSRSLAQACALLSAMTVAGGCTSLSPQLRPTDFEELETVSDRSEREQAYADNAIYRHDEPQGMRYTKGTSDRATKRSWQSLDVILRSDASASAALPTRELRISRVLTALTVVAGILTVAGTAASAREGLDLQRLNGTGGLLLGGGLAAVGFGITAGVFYGKTKKGYARAVDVYNDSLSVRLGLNTPSGEYIPPEGVIVDNEGYIVLDERERGLGASEPEPEPPPAAVTPAPTVEPAGEPPPAAVTPEPAGEPPPAAVTPAPEPAPASPPVQTPTAKVPDAAPPPRVSVAPHAAAEPLDLRPR